MKTRRQFLTQTLKGIDVLAVELKPGWDYRFVGETLYGAHPEHPPEKLIQDPDGTWRFAQILLHTLHDGMGTAWSTLLPQDEREGG